MHALENSLSSDPPAFIMFSCNCLFYRLREAKYKKLIVWNRVWRIEEKYNFNVDI